MDIKDIVQSTAEAATGAIGRTRKENLVTIGNVVQAAIKRQGLEQIEAEWEKLKEEGKVAPDYINSNACRDRFSRVCRYLDSDYVDQEVLAFIKQIFLKAAVVGDESDLLPSHFIDLVSEMEMGEISILTACYQCYKGQGYVVAKQTGGYRAWSEEIAKRTGLKYSFLVDKYHAMLVEKGLVNERFHVDQSGFNEEERCGLSELGLDLLRFANHL